MAAADSLDVLEQVIGVGEAIGGRFLESSRDQRGGGVAHARPLAQVSGWRVHLLAEQVDELTLSKGGRPAISSNRVSPRPYTSGAALTAPAVHCSGACTAASPTSPRQLAAGDAEVTQLDGELVGPVERTRDQDALGLDVAMDLRVDEVGDVGAAHGLEHPCLFAEPVTDGVVPQQVGLQQLERHALPAGDVD